MLGAVTLRLSQSTAGSPSLGFPRVPARLPAGHPATRDAVPSCGAAPVPQIPQRATSGQGGHHDQLV
eukprot:4048263-Alexandrium_andersonii.AAC.1